MTHRVLAEIRQPHFMVVEPQEVQQYQAVCDPLATILPLDMSYKERYENFDDLGLTKSTGPGPARNFAWDHSLSMGAQWHWVMDDNISNFYRMNRNTKITIATPAFFRAIEDFARRYTNLGMCGPNYEHFAVRRSLLPAFVINTRIYSCNLIRNDIPFRWRGRYNEDTDLSLNLLKAGWCTVQFNAFLQKKIATQRMAGGNTAEFYAEEGTRPKSEMLARMHPDVAEVVFKFNRWHHQVDYSRWRTMPLKRKPDAVVKDGVDNWGMVLQQEVAGKWLPIDDPKAPPKRHVYADGGGK
jgi:hypothetical protein